MLYRQATQLYAATASATWRGATKAASAGTQASHTATQCCTVLKIATTVITAASCCFTCSPHHRSPHGPHPCCHMIPCGGHTRQQHPCSNNSSSESRQTKYAQTVRYGTSCVSAVCTRYCRSSTQSRQAHGNFAVTLVDASTAHKPDKYRHKCAAQTDKTIACVAAYNQPQQPNCTRLTCMGLLCLPPSCLGCRCRCPVSPACAAGGAQRGEQTHQTWLPQAQASAGQNQDTICIWGQVRRCNKGFTKHHRRTN